MLLRCETPTPRHVVSRSSSPPGSHFVCAAFTLAMALREHKYFEGKNKMFESRSIQKNEPAVSNDQHQTLALDLQIGMLKEAAGTVLNQLELLRKALPGSTSPNITDFYDEVRRFEIELINSALYRTKGNQQRAARLLGVKATTLNSKIKRYKIMLPFLSKFSHD